MSHMVSVKTSMKSKTSQAAACRRLNIAAPTQGSYCFADGKKAAGSLIRLPGWRHPVVIDESGECHFDNYGGSWGDIARFNELKQAYAVEAILAKAKGKYRVRETRMANGSVKIEAMALAG